MKNNHDNDVSNNENKNYNTTFKQNEIWKRFFIYDEWFSNTQLY